MDLIIVLGIVGSVASIIALVISSPGVKSKVIHVAYGLLVTALAAGLVSYQHKMRDAQREVETLLRIEKEADAILRTADTSTSGSMSGFMLACLSFLEKYKQRFPETYRRAVKLCENSGVIGNPQDTTNSLTHFYSLQEGSSAMKYLLEGISAAAGTK